MRSVTPFRTRDASMQSGALPVFDPLFQRGKHVKAGNAFTPAAVRHTARFCGANRRGVGFGHKDIRGRFRRKRLHHLTDTYLGAEFLPQAFEEAAQYFGISEPAITSHLANHHLICSQILPDAVVASCHSWGPEAFSAGAET